MKRKKPPPPPQPPAKQAEAREVAARLQAAVAFREVGIEKLAGLVGDGKPKSRNTVSAHLKPKPWSRPLPPKMRRTYERVLRLPTLSLDSGTPQQLVGMLQNAPLRGREPYHAPFEGHGGGLDAAANFVLGQFRVYEKAGLPIPPQIIAVLAGELEAAMGRGEGSAAAPPGKAVGSETLGGG